MRLPLLGRLGSALCYLTLIAFSPVRGFALDEGIDRTALEGLDEQQSARVAELVEQIDALWRDDRFEDALDPAREVTAAFEAALGPDHWQVGDARRRVDTLAAIAALPEEGQRAMADDLRAAEEAKGLWDRSECAEAEQAFRELVTLRARWLGDEHPRVAAGRDDVAEALWAQARYGEAETEARRALEIKVAGLGADHHGVGFSRDMLGRALSGQGRLAEAEAELRRALEIMALAFGVDHPELADVRNNLAVTIYNQGRYAEAEAEHRRALRARVASLGADHIKVANSRANLAAVLCNQGRHAEAEEEARRSLRVNLAAFGKDHIEVAASHNNLAAALKGRRRFAEAEEELARALEIVVELLSDDHPTVAVVRNNLAALRSARGRDPEADYRRILREQIARQGADHPDVATYRNNLAEALRAKGRHAEAEEEYRQALDILVSAFGEGNLRVALTRRNLANVLDDQGRHAEAEEEYRRALEAGVATLGPDDLKVASTRDGLALVLRSQGRYAEAEVELRQALAAKVAALGEDDPDVAVSRSRLATVLWSLGRRTEAETELRRSLAIKVAALGEDDPDVAVDRNNMGVALGLLGRYAEAEAEHRRVLEARLAALGDDSHDYAIAISRSHLGDALRSLGRHAEAEEQLRLAVETLLETSGADHPRTAEARGRLAATLDERGDLDGAIEQLVEVVRIRQDNRIDRAASGLDRAAAEDESHQWLAIALARAGRPVDAWRRWEDGLARGLLDDAGSRPLDESELRRELDLLGRTQAVDELVSLLLAEPDRTAREDDRLDLLRREANRLRADWIAFSEGLEEKYGALAGLPAELEAIRLAIPDGAALVGWLDDRTHHWACLLAGDGEPVWVRLPGSGADGAWTEEDERLRDELRDALIEEGPAEALADRLARLRLSPLLPHLEGIEHLIVLTSPGLDGVPVELLVDALPGARGRLVSYAPSGSLLALLSEPRPEADSDGPPRLLAIGDPTYAAPDEFQPDESAEPPASGVAVVMVTPEGVAAAHGIRRGDVLLSYDDEALVGPGGLSTVPAESGRAEVPLTIWRDGEEIELTLEPGPLGVQIDPDRTAAEAVLALRVAREARNPLSRGETWARLKGTRREVEALIALFGDDRADSLLGDRATEGAVQGLAETGELSRYRYLHFATHGIADNQVAMNSAIILAPDRPAVADAAPADAIPTTDGRITARQIVRTWNLDADLVTLSACETGLGRRTAGGEGVLGFAPALFVKGARTVVLSLWRVDDEATALLMTRFYENLLGKPDRLDGPMPKAEALDEAKRWLRGLSAAEAARSIAAIGRGEVRRRREVPIKAAERPYEHSRYWSAFVLIGNPE